jgi:hypothetical protein
MAQQNQNPDKNASSMGQVKDNQGAHGRRLSEQQDVGELSAQNRGGTTARGLEETPRLEQDDRDSSAQSRTQGPDILDTTDDDTCDTTAELQEIFAEEDRQAANPQKKKPNAADAETPGAGNTKADRAAAEAIERDTESYVDEAE